MSRTPTNEAIVAITATLILAALAFAWLRARPGTADTPEPVVTDPADPADPALWQALGARVYDNRCASCHEDGHGTRRMPPLRGYAVDLFHADGGRDYLIDLLLYGLEGEFTVGDARYDARHPVYEERLTDEEAAAVLNHMLTSWNNADLLDDTQPLYTPDDITARRGRDLSPADVLPLRPEQAD